MNFLRGPCRPDAFYLAERPALEGQGPRLKTVVTGVAPMADDPESVWCTDVIHGGVLSMGAHWVARELEQPEVLAVQIEAIRRALKREPGLRQQMFMTDLYYPHPILKEIGLHG
jgi:hypothetical protein